MQSGLLRHRWPGKIFATQTIRKTTSQQMVRLFHDQVLKARECSLGNALQATVRSALSGLNLMLSGFAQVVTDVGSATSERVLHCLR